MSRLSFGWAAGLALALALPVRAERLVHRTWTAADGLLDSRVSAIAEDRQGYLWVGTDDGVSRFDGVSFTRFRFRGRPGFPRGAVASIREAADGRIFFGLGSFERLGGGVVIFDRGRWRLPPAASGLVNGEVGTIVERPGGGLLFGAEAGVVELLPDGRYHTLVARDEIAGRFPNAVLPARDGSLYIGTLRGAFRRSVDGRIEPLPALGERKISAIHEGAEGTLYFGTASLMQPTSGLWALRAGTFVPPGTAGLPGFDIHTLAEGGGTLYVAGVELVVAPGGDLARGFRLGTAEGLLHPRVRAVCITRGGSVYLGTDRGLALYDRGRVTAWGVAEGLPSRRAAPLLAMPDGTVWAGFDAGLGVYDGRGWAPWTGSGLGAATRVPVTALWRAPSGELWVGFATGAVGTVEGGRLRLRSSAGYKPVRAFAAGLGGAVYVGYDDNGRVQILAGGRLVDPPWLAGDRLFRASIPGLAAAPDGTLYLATSRGLGVVAGGRLRLLGTAEGLADPTVLAVLVGHDGSIYAGTRSGLSIWRGGRFVPFGARGELAEQAIDCLVEDGAGRLYASTPGGVTVLDSARSRVVRRLFSADGIPAGGGEPGACGRDAAGRLWFGGGRGIAVYDPGREAPATAPRLHLTGVLAGRRELRLQRFVEEMLAPPPAGRALTLASGESDVVVSYVGIDLASPGSVRYRYRLVREGESRPFLDTAEREVRFSHLDPGSYRFDVAAGRAWGPWSPPAVLALTVRPPFWRSGWFLALSGAAAVGLAAGLAALRARRLLAVERLRTALAANLHDHVGSGLTEIAVLAEVAARRPGAPAGDLARISATARDLVDRMSDLVWLVHPQKDSLHQLFLRLTDVYAHLFGERGVAFRAADLGALAELKLPMAERQHLYLLFKEALANALRHSGCRRIELAARRQGRQLTVTLSDDGRGFAIGDRVDRTQGNGLGNMARRAERLGGRLEIDTRPGGGTVVRLALSLP